jgi:hypothetical protein
MRIRQIVVGTSLIVLAAIPELYIQYRLHAHNWNPLKSPILLQVGTVRTPGFVTDLNGFYEVGLAFQPKNIDLEECLLGDRLFQTSCEKLGSGLKLDWAVIREGWNENSPVVGPKAYDPRAFGGAGVVQTQLGGFEAQRGKRYAVVLNVHSVSSELNAASPQVRVEAARIYWEKWVIFNQLIFWLSFVLGSVGLIIVAFSFRQDKH